MDEHPNFGANMANTNKSLLALAVWASVVASAGANEGLVEAPSPAIVNSENPEALAALAVRYEHAEGMPRDYVKAAELYCRSARAGNANAQFALGWMYANGRGVPRDDGVALQLFVMAGEQGHAHAMEMQRFVRSATPSPLPKCMLPDEPVIEALQDPPAEGLANSEFSPSDDAALLEQFSRGPIFDLVYRLAPEYEIDPKLVLAVIYIESGFNVRAKSPRNAQGLMQLIPETAQRFRVKNAYDPADNIKGGLAYLQWLLAYFKGNVPLVLAAYNAGERTVEKYRGIPPYQETRDYVKKITRLYKKPTHPYKPDRAKAAAFVTSP